jgi:hypothetical protein
VKPPTEITAAAANISPQRRLHCRREATGASSIRSANVLMMNKELVEIRRVANPPNAEEPDGRAGPDSRDEPCDVLALSQSGPTPLGESLEETRPNEAGASNEIAFSQHQVRSEILSSPALEQRGNGRTELVEEITQFKALLHVQRDISHAAAVYEALTII